MKKKSFRDVLNLKWNAKHLFLGLGAVVENNKAIFEIIHTWKNDIPLINEMECTEQSKLFNLLFYSQKMFLILEQSQDTKSKELIDKILSGQLPKSINAKSLM